MIALIATDLGNRLHVSAESGVSNGKTLVIVPPAGNFSPVSWCSSAHQFLLSTRELGRAIITVSTWTLTTPITLFRLFRSRSNIIRHVVKSALAWGRHHGKSRLTKLSELESFNLVLTTYHTVSAEWRNGKQAEKSVMFCTKWRRVILDEGRNVELSGIPKSY